ncbi:MAG: quinolinate synthase NadA [Deltaproteobacteria bacterium]|nr:quinolinate synthase NadA [Deltaproteobacteria bacterium]
MNELKSDVIKELNRKILDLKRKRNAVILAHNYQVDEVQAIADHTGDSLELSRLAVDSDAEVIVFCGVHFMAESAAILNPGKTVLLPASYAGCPMADMVTVEKLRALKAEHPGVPVVAYVNTSAAVKAESDICCTSANVVRVINSLDTDRVICIPDKNLSAYAQQFTEKKIIPWKGFCIVHNLLTAEMVREAKAGHPGALVLAHPECPMEVLELADHVTSTSGMLRYAEASEAGEFIVCTERGLLYNLRNRNPGKVFHIVSDAPTPWDLPMMTCQNMKRTTLELVARSLEEMETVITVPEEIRLRSVAALERMLAIP